MKTLLSLFTFTVSALCQPTAFYTWNLQTSPGDTAIPVATSLDGAVALSNYLFRNVAAQSTLSASCAAAATTCTFSSVAGAVVGGGVCFSSPCGVTASATGGPPPTTFTLSGGEVALITAINGNTLTLKRNSIGTATNANSNQVVTFLVAGSYSQQTANIVAAGVFPIIGNCAYGAYTTATNCTAIATANAALSTVK